MYIFCISWLDLPKNQGSGLSCQSSLITSVTSSTGKLRSLSFREKSFPRFVEIATACRKSERSWRRSGNRLNSGMIRRGFILSIRITPMKSICLYFSASIALQNRAKVIVVTRHICPEMGLFQWCVLHLINAIAQILSVRKFLNATVYLYITRATESVIMLQSSSYSTST